MAIWLTMLALLFFTGAGCLLYEAGQGKVRYDKGDFKLPVNEVYEKLGSVPIVETDSDNADVVVILKDREGKLLAYRLSQDPPEYFIKKIGKDGKPTYVPYPSWLVRGPH